MHVHIAAPVGSSYRTCLGPSNQCLWEHVGPLLHLQRHDPASRVAQVHARGALHRRSAGT